MFDRQRNRGVFGALLFAALFIASSTVDAQGSTLRVSDATGGQGELIAVPIELDLTGPETVAGFSFGVCHDASALQIQSVDLGSAITGFNGGAGPDFVDLTPTVGAGFTAGVVFDFDQTEVLPIALGAEILVAQYLGVVEGDSTVEVCGTLGSPLVAVVVTTSAGQTTIPTLEAGTVTVTPAPGTFRRGDLNGDGVKDETDYDLLESWLFELPGGAFQLGTTPPTGCDLQPNQSGDINDNEVETIADLLMFREFLDCGTISVPGPSDACGDDPDDDTGGFDLENPDPNYLISAFTINITGEVDEERDVEILLQVLSPTPVKAVSLGIEIGSALSPAPVPLTVASGVSADFFASIFDGQSLVVAAGSSTCGVPMMPGAPTFQFLGSLHLKLAPFAIFPPAQWREEVVISGRGRRTTIVDDAFQDHNPFTVSGTFEFARGNSNNLDAAVNIADAVYTLGYLFPQGSPVALDCEDAADTNNDGQIDIADPIFLLGFLFAGGTPIPSPYPECGFDFDLDLLTCDSAICP